MERRERFGRRDCRLKTQRVVINVSGQRFVTHIECLKRQPNTLLGSGMISMFYDGVRKEYFFDRDPNIFRYILNYYRTGKLHASPADCLDAFQDELDFFGISISEIEERCWSPASETETNHIHHYAPKERGRLDQMARNSDVSTICNEKCVQQNKDGACDKEGNKRRSYAKVESNSVNINQRNCGHEQFELENDPPGRKCGESARKIPGSKLRGLFNCLYGFFIASSIAVSSVETVDCSVGRKCEEQYPDTFFAIDTFFVVVFSFEYLIRFVLSPNRRAFLKDFFNIIDVLAILPYYINLMLILLVGTKDELVAFRVLRVFRVMKLSRRSSRLQSLLLTLRNCYTDLAFMYFTFTLGIILFGSVLYYTEKDEDREGFESIPHSLWYTCVSMMTTGYGDVVPYTVLGKIVGGLCGICGVVIMTLPIPIMQDKKIMVEA